MSGGWTKILDIKFKGKGEVFNFSVANNNNYYVGNSRLLTHNADCVVGKVGSASEMINKGIHAHVDEVEISLRPGYGGEIIFKPATTTSRAGFNDALPVLQNNLMNNKSFLNNLIRTTRGARDRFSSSKNPREAGMGAEFNFLLKSLEKYRK